MPVADSNRLILTGENPLIRLNETDSGTNFTTNASYWRPAGPGHVLYLKSELTANQSRIYSDNIAMARWLQFTVQDMLNADLADQSIPVTRASFYKEGDPRYSGPRRSRRTTRRSRCWYEIGEPLLIHTEPNTEPGRPYGVCTVLVPPLGARLTRSGVKGKPWPREREGRPFSTQPVSPPSATQQLQSARQWLSPPSCQPIHRRSALF
jgi:hypothetical protein